MSRLLHICTGMPMSGSRLGFEMAAAVLEEAGVPQRRLDGAVPPRQESNLIPALDAERLATALEVAAAGPGPIAVHCHAGPGGEVGDAAAAGLLTAQLVARDPRDVALSLLDAAQTLGGQRNPEGEPLASVAEAMDLVRRRMEDFARWQAAVPGLLVLNYEELVARPDRTLARIAAHLGVEVDAERIIARRQAQFNKLGRGISQRWREEMTVAEANGIHEEFADYIERWCLPEGLPGRV